MPVSYIQSKLISNAFVGQVNNLTALCHVVASGSVVPPFDINEQAIAAVLYQRDFYVNKFNALANGTAIAWTRVRDGDSEVVRTDTANLMRVYRDMEKQLNLQLNNLAYNYRQANGIGRSVDFYSIDNSWNGTAGLGNPYVAN